MGREHSIPADKFPVQSPRVGRAVTITFHYDTSKELLGEIVRDDAVAPHLTIIKLLDGRYVLSTECQYGFRL